MNNFHPCATPGCKNLAYDKHVLCWPHWAKEQDEKKRAVRALRTNATNRGSTTSKEKKS